MEPVKIFVLNLDAEVLAKCLAFLTEQGYEADGESDVKVAFAKFAEKPYEIAVLGGGIDHPSRQKIKSDFPKTSPDVEFVEHFCPPNELLGEIEEAFKD